MSGKLPAIRSCNLGVRSPNPVDVLGEEKALYARISSYDQQTLPLQIKTMREYALRRGWQITTEIKEIGSVAVQRAKREELLAAARFPENS
jgi:predicted site-specific integrase-resolvase